MSKTTLVVSAPIEEALQSLRTTRQENAKWNGPESASVKTLDLSIALLEDALRKGSEAWLTTAEVHEATGISKVTLHKRAAAKLEGRPVPNAWKQLQVRRTNGNAFLFRASTLPMGRNKAA